MIVLDNVGQDIYIKDVQSSRGTKIDFLLALKSKKKLSDLFHQYTDESFVFSKTGVMVRLYHQDIDYVSRSQARRILAGLEKFKTIELDFKDVKTVRLKGRACRRVVADGPPCGDDFFRADTMAGTLALVLLWLIIMSMSLLRKGSSTQTRPFYNPY